MKYLLLFLMMCSVVCWGATNTFDGAVDNDWNDAGNWNTDGAADRVPIDGDAAIIPNTFTVVIDTAAIDCDTIQFTGDGSATLDASVVTSCVIDATLDCDGTGGLVISNGAASPTVTITGDIDGSGTNHFVTLTNSILTVNGDITGPAGGTNESGVWVNGGSANLTVNGNVTGGTAAICYGVYVTSTGTVDINGTVTGSSSSASSHGMNIANASATISADVMNIIAGSTVPIAGFWPTGTIVKSVAVDGKTLGGGYRSRYR